MFSKEDKLMIYLLCKTYFNDNSRGTWSHLNGGSFDIPLDEQFTITIDGYELECADQFVR